jgi:3-hydroxyisobutyrate dehydrogenase
MKLVTNYVAGATRVALAEGLALAAAMGVPGGRALDICRHAAAGSQTLEEFDRKYFHGDIERTDFSIDLRYKDFRLTSELARQLGVPMFLNGVIVELYQMMRARGLGTKDINAVGPFVADLADVDLKAGGKKSGSRGVDRIASGREI